MADELKGDYDKVAEMFKEKLESQISGESTSSQDEIPQSRSYSDFKKQYLPKHLSLYEKLCQFAEKTIPFKPDDKKAPALQEAINTCHLNTSPTGVYSASLVVPLAIILFALIFFFMLPVVVGSAPNFFFIIFALLASLGIMIPLQKLPFILANSWRMKASNQMVLSVFYMVTYMRHTSNLELAVNFASQHLTPPLSLDLRKVVWDVETEKYSSIKESLTSYLETWRNYNMEFVESVHLIQASLFEGSEERRLGSLDKALSVMLDETYEKMLHYAHNLKSPLTTLNMLGVVLPILTLVILPLVVSFMEGFRWYHLFALYNIALPLLVYSLGKNILSTRPGGSGDEDITQKNPEFKKLKKVSISLGKDEKLFLKPQHLALIVFLVLFFIGLFPAMWSASNLPDYGLVEGPNGLQFDQISYQGRSLYEDSQIKFSFIGKRKMVVGGTPTDEMVGPFGLGAMLIGICVPLSIGFSIGLYYRLRSKKLIKIRKQAKQLELEFSSALFQLGNRIGDGIPAELAFGKVASVMENSTSGKFFMLVHTNITRLGMSVEKAIFDPRKGALQYYPSDLIESSMKVLVESTKKGPLVASQALINVSAYIKQMHRVDERLNDLMGDVISSMKSQTLFLTPVISGIVVGITSMITKIIGKLGTSFETLSSGTQGVAGGSAVLGMFGTGIPTYQFQIVVGLYVVQLAYILTVIANGIKNGPDKIAEEAELGKNMTKATVLYCVLAGIIILVFNIVASSIMGNIGA